MLLNPCPSFGEVAVRPRCLLTPFRDLFMYSRSQSFIRSMICKCVPLVCGLSSQALNTVFGRHMGSQRSPGAKPRHVLFLCTPLVVKTPSPTPMGLPACRSTPRTQSLCASKPGFPQLCFVRFKRMAPWVVGANFHDWVTIRCLSTTHC